MEFRALQPGEIEAWYDHVTSVFHGSRRYFMNHWENDPWKDSEGIRVAVEDGRIVSTVRVFIRQMYLHGEQVSAGGIGEVSTHPEYRRRGLATRLLQDAIRFMEEREIAISSLHGGRSIYEALGWENVTRYYASSRKSATYEHTFQIRPVNNASEIEIEQIATLYGDYSRRFNGTFVRDHPKYWSGWVRTESPQAWVAEQAGSLYGYISVRRNDENLYVKEFLASEEMFAQDGGKHVFDALISHLLTAMGKDTFDVVWPAPVADGFHADKIHEHGGPKYRVICASRLPENDGSISELLHCQPEAWNQGLQSHHVFWNTDGF